MSVVPEFPRLVTVIQLVAVSVPLVAAASIEAQLPRFRGFPEGDDGEPDGPDGPDGPPPVFPPALPPDLL